MNHTFFKISFIMMMAFGMLIPHAMGAVSAGKMPESAGSWTESGEVSYSFAYARTRLGFERRKSGWRCVRGFLSGSKNDMEHSVWIRGKKKAQMMIWRIDTGKSGYSWGEIPETGKKGCGVR